jgi:putative tricarboxylic transport membrane protein
MEIFNQLLGGLSVGIQPMSILMVSIGLIVGILVGAAPGMGGVVGLALTLPLALRMTPELAVILFVAILVGQGFGNSIPAVLIKVPGTTSAVLTVIEGYPFHLRGESHRALLVSLLSSVQGSFFSVLVFVMFVGPLAAVAVRLLNPEIFAIVFVGLLACAGLMNGQFAKGMVAVGIGLLLATIGTDPVTGSERLTFGVDRLFTGLSVIPVVIGLLAVRQILESAGELLQVPRLKEKFKSFNVGWLSKEDRKSMRFPSAVGAVLGTFIGAIPGAGGSVASFISYDAVKRMSKDKTEFGTGTGVKGLAAVDSANNSVVGGELIPTLGLGIPGAPPMVIVMAVLSAQGLIPGPKLLTTRPGLLYATFGGLLVATVLLIFYGYLSIGPSIFLSKISPPATLVTTGVLVVIGIYSLRWSIFDVWVALGMGVLAFFFEKYGYPVAPMALAFILGAMMEASLRRGLIMTFGWKGFITRPVTLGILIASILLFGGAAYLTRDRSRSVDVDG